MSERARTLFAEARSVVERTAERAGESNVPMMAAALSFYLLVTLVPIVIVLVSVAGIAARLALEPAAEVPLDSAAAAFQTLAAAWPFESSTLSVVFTVGVVVFGAAAVFSQFVLAVSRIFGDTPQRSAIRAFARRHLISFGLLGVLALALLASLVAGALLAALVAELKSVAGLAGFELAWLDGVATARLAAELVAAFLLFATAFAVIPQRRLGFRDVLPGAAATAVAYAVGQLVLSSYLASSARVASYGSLSAVVALLLWVYYTAMIALYGAAFTYALIGHAEGKRTHAQASALES